MSKENPHRLGAAVRVEHLWKAFSETTIAVRDVSMAIEPGEFVTLLGPSGSGKTTTLMMIAGFVAPSHGEIFIDDQPVSTLPPQKRDLGMVFQNYALFPHMTVAENIAFPLEMRGMSKAEISRRVADALEMVQLSGYEQRYPRQLSGGQQQRVALARAVVFDARVLLMDEPLGALDKKLREHMQLEIKHIQQRLNVTVIYVTHDQEEALTMSDRIAVMNHGQIEQFDAPTVLYEEPASPFVAGFIGESNFLSGTIVSLDADGVVEIEHPSVGRFRAVQRGGKHTTGQVVLASIRPERIRFADESDVGAALNQRRGRVIEEIYVGDAMKYKVVVGDEILTIKEQSRNSRRPFAVGDEVDIVWEPVHAKVVGTPDRDGGLNEIPIERHPSVAHG